MNTGSSKQLPLPLDLGERASFANFLVGSNAELVTALQSLPNAQSASLLFLYGPKSAGKSHLLFALVKTLAERDLTVNYLSLADAHFDAAMLTQLDAAQIHCLDNIEQLVGDEAGERALFTLIEQVKHQDGTLVMTAAKPPEKCGFNLKDLVSRLSSHMVYALQPMNDEQQFAAIKMRAEQRGLAISDDTVRFLLRRSSRDSAELFAVLDHIDRASLIEKRKITIPFLQTLI